MSGTLMAIRWFGSVWHAALHPDSRARAAIRCRGKMAGSSCTGPWPHGRRTIREMAVFFAGIAPESTCGTAHNHRFRAGSMVPVAALKSGGPASCHFFVGSSLTKPGFTEPMDPSGEPDVGAPRSDCPKENLGWLPSWRWNGGSLPPQALRRVLNNCSVVGRCSSKSVRLKPVSSENPPLPDSAGFQSQAGCEA